MVTDDKFASQLNTVVTYFQKNCLAINGFWIKIGFFTKEDTGEKKIQESISTLSRLIFVAFSFKIQKYLAIFIFYKK